MSETDINSPGPTLGELREAGVDARVVRLSAEMDAKLGTTRRGRLALRLSHWYARRRPRRPVRPGEQHMSGSPLEDPAYEPKHPPVNGEIPEVVARWGARSQLRWFQRFGGQLGKRRDWDRYYVHSVDHLGPCCTSCEEDNLFPERCCCRAPGPA